MELEKIDGFEGDLFEFTNLDAESTGLTKMVWIEANTFPEPRTLGPCLKVSRFAQKIGGDYWVSVSLSEQPEVLSGVPEDISDNDLSLVKDWIVLNRSALLAHWQGDSDSVKLMLHLKRLDGHPVYTRP